MSKYQVDDIIDVRVTAIRDYGALVLTSDDCKGLLHISEVSPFYVANIHDFVHINDVIKVKVIEIDEKTDFLKLSLKQLPELVKKSKKKAQHEKINQNEIDFTPLKAMLPIWIAQAKEQQND